MDTEPWAAAGRTVTLDAGQWEAFLDSLYERDDVLAVRTPEGTYRRGEVVDAYVLSAHAEAFQSAEVDGDVWGTLEDIDETAADEVEAWRKIAAFYASRGCVLVQVTGLEEPEEWIFSAELAASLGLVPKTSAA